MTNTSCARIDPDLWKLARYQVGGRFRVGSPVRIRDDQGARWLRSRPLDPRPTPEPTRREEIRFQPLRPVVCLACRFIITDEGFRIQRDGDHEHTFFNPRGFLFRIGCFSHAPGCVTVGAASLEFTWFPRHAWTVALCQGCQGHLGWLYHSSHDHASFWGLILDRLTQKESS